ncbi:HAD family phosphatase [Halorussus gelatinilyticus]|uniref:HAD family phosphatase n=1 Tax=Halorussus gelatinilyticus TaxID=2937524 RepID=A0A8U0IMI1_9EURY|nr:HAD family phosphatase [Halorussus gelatinilyticus]UPW01821.1 HAD family phosphatase [Halorussus gelatinilyticus]
MQSKAVLFDMDGVIVNSERYWVETEESEILPAAVDGSPDTSETTGMNFREIYDYLEARHEMTETKDEFVDRYENAARDIYGEKVALMDGFEDLLADLRDEGRTVALVSSSPHDWIDRMLDRFDLRESFDRIISAEEIDGKSKPEPDVYEFAAKEVGVEPADCIAVEDSENGVRSAKRAGMQVVGYRNESDEELDLSEADAVAASAEELREILLAE